MFSGRKISTKDSRKVAADAMLKDSVHEAFARQWSIIGDRVNLENTAKTIAEAIDSIANIVCTDTEGYILYANRLFCEINKCELNDIIGKRNNIFKSGFHSREFYNAMWHQLKANNFWRGELCNQTFDGKLYWTDTTITPWHDSQGEIGGYVALRMDITARKQAEAQALEENRMRQEMETLLNDIVETVPNGIIAYDKDGRITFFNKANLEIYDQFLPGIGVGRRRQDLIDRAQLTSLLETDQGLSLPSGMDSIVKRVVHRLPDGRWVQVQSRKSSSGTIVSVQTDVTDVKRIEQQIAFQAERDPLTATFNRHALLRHLSDTTTDEARAAAQSCTLVLIDFDDFKAINDGLGHDAGDTFLCSVAQRLQSTVRSSDIVARLGGDEFAILLPGAHDDSGVMEVVTKLHKALAAPIRIGAQTVMPSASMGVATFPQDGANPAELMKSSDLALYRCKHESRGGFRIYDTSMRHERIRRETLTAELRHALEQNAFTVVLQPQLNMATGKHTGFEALVRWKLDGRWVPPQELISIAEEAGLVTRLSYQIVEKTLATIARLKHAGLEPGTVGLNAVAAQLHEPNFVRNLLGLLRKYGIAPNEIEIEVTENVILDRSAKNIERVLHKLHSTGMSIALDDFGMGYASLTHLKRFPLSRLKIDRSFINGLPDDTDDHVIVRTIISLAHNLGLQVVAEGIETRMQFDELVRLNCDFAQGFMIGRPMDENAAADYCRRSKSQAAVRTVSPFAG